MDSHFEAKTLVECESAIKEEIDSIACSSLGLSVDASVSVSVAVSGRLFSSPIGNIFTGSEEIPFSGEMGPVSGEAGPKIPAGAGNFGFRGS